MARKDTLKQFKEVLLERREALRQAIAGDDRMLRELTQRSGGDVIDFASDSAFEEMNSQLAEVASRELVNVENALKRLNNGSYGKCEACGSVIAIARLQALPYATYCIECQRDLENYRRHGQGNTDWGRILEQPTDTPVGDMDYNVS
jgi:DnaK suppressor protein